jgi:hypothetical protein
VHQNNVDNKKWMTPFVRGIDICLDRLTAPIFYGILIFGIVQTVVKDPVIQSCVKDPQFTVHFKFGVDGGQNDIGIFLHDGRGGWGMRHWRVDTYKYAMNFESLKVEKEGLFRNVSWPEDSAVRYMEYALQNIEGKGSMKGYCGKKRMQGLNGTIEMEPLRMEWTYTDPVALVKENKVLESEGRWFYQRKHRPLVNLHDGEKVVFRAVSTQTVCGGGDGDLRTAVVPAGMMMIAEQKYRGRY